MFNVQERILELQTQLDHLGYELQESDPDDLGAITALTNEIMQAKCELDWLTAVDPEEFN